MRRYWRPVFAAVLLTAVMGAAPASAAAPPGMNVITDGANLGTQVDPNRTYQPYLIVQSLGIDPFSIYAINVQVNGAGQHLTIDSELHGRTH